METRERQAVDALVDIGSQPAKVTKNTINEAKRHEVYLTLKRNNWLSAVDRLVVYIQVTKQSEVDCFRVSGLIRWKDMLAANPQWFEEIWCPPAVRLLPNLYTWCSMAYSRFHKLNFGKYKHLKQVFLTFLKVRPNIDTINNDFSQWQGMEQLKTTGLDKFLFCVVFAGSSRKQLMEHGLTAEDLAIPGICFLIDHYLNAISKIY